MGHPAADAIEIEEPDLRESFGGPVTGEPPGRLLGEHSLGDEVAKNGMQGVAVAAGRRG